MVGRPKPGHLFHPKLWALRFVDVATGESTLRLLVLSRNLTGDRSWDVCLRLDGTRATRPIADNRPLFDLIRGTLRLVTAPLAPTRLAAVEALAEDLRRAEWEHPEGVRSLLFHAMGVRGGSVPDFTGTRHLIVSPFCTADSLLQRAPGEHVTLVSRQEALDALPIEALEGLDTFVINGLAGLPADEATADRVVLTGLHAKVYVVEKGNQARVLLGSANATTGAFGGNVEFLVELVGGRTAMGIDALVGPQAALREILEPYARNDAAGPDEEDLRLREFIRDIAAIPLTATVATGPDGFGIRLTSEEPLPEEDDVRLTAQLHTRPGEALRLALGQPVAVNWTGLALTDVTPFIVITAQSDQERERTVVLATLIDDPAERLDEVLAGQVKTPDDFLRFLKLMLGLGTEAMPEVNAASGNGSGVWRASTSGLFELLLSALVDRPDQLDDLERLVSRLERTDAGVRLLPPGFAEIWQLMRQARDAAGTGVRA
ncbi:hypothetical protein GCM10007977_046930 [Dactylosporangium sucinum]|uniref:PLD phosphodiesterase domain-containing protein n=1 Tax=Dactylosporangium sucinum TaxID=1424081 RepID=A0A917TW47_9ACTN|nr:hypothetical protein GCM10007977_046930 [Dactylosporangium sucinum]